MMMLIGESIGSVSGDGTFRIPDQYLAELGSNPVLTRGLDRNLLLFPADTWHSLVEKLMAKPITQAEVRAFRRRLFSGAVELVSDADGRFILPPSLRDFARINEQLFIAGSGDHLELWSDQEWLPVLRDFTDTSAIDRWDDLGI